MRVTGWCVVFVASVVFPLFVSQAESAPGTETVTVEAAEPVAPADTPIQESTAAPVDEVPAPTATLPEAPAPYTTSLKDAISENLIDLSGLRARLDRPVESNVLRLTLSEAIQIAVKNNPDILIAAYDPAKAEAETFAARGEFDPFHAPLTFSRPSSRARPPRTSPCRPPCSCRAPRASGSRCR